MSVILSLVNDDLIFLQTAEKWSQTKFYENAFSGIRVAPCRQMDNESNEASNRFLQFYERPLKPGNYFKILNVRDRHTKTRTNSTASQPLTLRQLPFPQRKQLDFWIRHALYVHFFNLEPPNQLSHNMNVIPSKVSPMPYISFSYIR